MTQGVRSDTLVFRDAADRSRSWRETFRERRSENENPGGTKHCPRCGRDLAVEAFNRNGSLPGGRSGWCAECQRAATREWRARNPQHAENYNRKRREAYQPRTLQVQKLAVTGAVFEVAVRPL
jgi:hypothetical protein